MNAWKTMLVYTLLAMVAAPMFAPATNKAPQMVFRFVEENNMFKVKTAENAKQDELTLTDLQKQSETAAASQEKDIQANTQPPGGETDDHRTCIYP